MTEELKPCPFCGNTLKDTSYDRGMVFGCEPCGYSRHFPGYLQTTPNDKPVPNCSGEFYHHDAKEKAIQKMNERYDN